MLTTFAETINLVIPNKKDHFETIAFSSGLFVWDELITQQFFYEDFLHDFSLSLLSFFLIVGFTEFFLSFILQTFVFTCRC